MLVFVFDTLISHSLSCSDFSSASNLFFVFTGAGEYIYVHKSQSLQVSQSAQLLSPLIRGPKCLRFYYYMNGGGDIANLDVLLWHQEKQHDFLMWRTSGKQGDEWMKASVDVDYTGESQVGGSKFLRAV